MFIRKNIIKSHHQSLHHYLCGPRWVNPRGRFQSIFHLQMLIFINILACCFVNLHLWEFLSFFLICPKNHYRTDTDHCKLNIIFSSIFTFIVCKIHNDHYLLNQSQNWFKDLSFISFQCSFSFLPPLMANWSMKNQTRWIEEWTIWLFTITQKFPKCGGRQDKERVETPTNKLWVSNK